LAHHFVAYQKRKKMKAIVTSGFGPPEVLQFKEVEKPEPKANEILIKVKASTVTRGDVILRKMHPVLALPMRLFGVRVKKIPGHEFSGVVEKVGRDVSLFNQGDQVFGTTTGLSIGANAEYICLPEKNKSSVLAIKPSNVKHDEAAALPIGGMTALYLLQKGNIQTGQKVLIYGASGSVGTYAVQLAKHFGAKVFGVCSTKNIELVKSLGADDVIDYTKEDYAQSNQTYDLIFDAVGKTSSSEAKRVLNVGGKFVTVKSMTREIPESFSVLNQLLELGEIKPFIDRRFSLEQVAEAHRYVESGHKRGNVVIIVNPDPAIK
jgi:NADPH:quinone reductase-like Zn-dependent oxidoreductase